MRNVTYLLRSITTMGDRRAAGARRSIRGADADLTNRDHWSGGPPMSDSRSSGSQPAMHNQARRRIGKTWSHERERRPPSRRRPAIRFALAGILTSTGALLFVTASLITTQAQAHGFFEFGFPPPAFSDDHGGKGPGRQPRRQAGNDRTDRSDRADGNNCRKRCDRRDGWDWRHGRDRSERSQRGKRPERTERAERPERTERAERAER